MIQLFDLRNLIFRQGISPLRQHRPLGSVGFGDHPENSARLRMPPNYSGSPPSPESHLKSIHPDSRFHLFLPMTLPTTLLHDRSNLLIPNLQPLDLGMPLCL